VGVTRGSIRSILRVAKAWANLNKVQISDDILDLKGDTAKSGKMIGKDGEPALSAYGIAEAIRLTAASTYFMPPITPEGIPIPIAVSALIRTWETTVLLYGYHLSENDPKNQTLYLRICPWLRESSGWSWLTDRGNEPKPLKHSLNKFKKFLNKLSKTYKNKIKKIYIEIPPKDTVMNDVPIDSDNWQKIIIVFRNREYRLAPLCNIRDTVYNKYGYQNEKGDIMEFMKWYTDIFDYSSTTVHIVAHSHIMQKFAKKNLGIDLDKQDKLVTSINPLIQGNITQQNCWSITMPYHATYDIKTINNIIKRSLDSGKVRLRDGQTLFLTGVIQESDAALVSKWPVLGDLPFFGQFFRKTNSGR
ncbi:MAG: hypothetical protein EB127_31215, partial [Alphaproteobacteria bacterium]|nr:hypothetical protein [Alphaproteobacteria bacterium]